MVPQYKADHTMLASSRPRGRNPLSEKMGADLHAAHLTVTKKSDKT